MADPTSEKLHSACDECRTRKLKCSGEAPQCSRCAREGIRCVYSPQKQMGRPRKRRREEEPPVNGPTPDLPTSTTPGFTSTLAFTEFGLISPPDFDDFSNLSGLPQDEAFSATTLSLSNDPLLTTSGLDGSHVDLGFSVDDPIDPSLWNTQSTASISTPNSLEMAQPEAPCTCLSIMYLALTDLQGITSFAFPGVIPQLRSAMSTATTMIQCERCPKEAFTAIQNIQSLTALLSAIAERFHKVIFWIDTEADRLERTGEKKTFRIADQNPALQHLHTGTTDCPMGFNVDLEASSWKKFAKRALKTEVLGGGSNPYPFNSLLELMEQRQHRWHASNINLEERERMFGPMSPCKPGEANCLRMIDQVRHMVDHMRWD